MTGDNKGVSDAPDTLDRGADEFVEALFSEERVRELSQLSDEEFHREVDRHIEDARRIAAETVTRREDAREREKTAA